MIRSAMEVLMASLWLAAVYSDVARDVTRTWVDRFRTDGRTFIAQTVLPRVKNGIDTLRGTVEERALASRTRGFRSVTTSPRG